MVVPGRIEVDGVTPVVSCGRYPAKAVVGEVVPVEAAVWRDGHDAVAATLVVGYLGRDYPAPPGPHGLDQDAPEGRAACPRTEPLLVAMTAGAQPYVFHGQFVPEQIGLWSFRVDGWTDSIRSWRDAVLAKLDAGQGEAELSNDLLIGAELFDR
ncbi:MAG: maltotransferase domain-containing protein, partial [Mycolicibacter algericus]